MVSRNGGSSDEVTQQIDTYLKKKITKGDFLDELKYHKSTHPIAFCTWGSLQLLEKMVTILYIFRIFVSEKA